jgi:hypothetical protein
MREDKQLDLDFDTYSKLFIAKIPLAKKVNKHTVAGRCISCGDSKLSQRKTRLYLMRERGKYPNIVTCHNCHLSTTAKIFFSTHFPEDMVELEKGLADRKLNQISSPQEKEENPSIRKIREEEEYWNSFNQEVERAKSKVGLFFEKFTVPLKYNYIAQKYIVSRCIPERFLSSMRLLNPLYHDQKRFRYAYLRDYSGGGSRPFSPCCRSRGDLGVLRLG